MTAAAPVEDFQLVPGSRYLVRSVLTRETVQESEGTFKGITTVGTTDSLLLEVGPKGGKGKVRLIPTHMIVSIDVLEVAAKAEAAKKRGPEEHVHYG
jgi:hypothetical protein